MIRDRRFRSLVLPAAAWAGAVLGHSLTYLLVVPNATVREALLRVTGHGYWPGAVSTAVVFALVALGVVAVRHFRLGLGSDRGGGRWESWSALAPVLVLAQASIYLIQENVERLAAGAPVSTPLTDHVLLLGVAVQVLVAAAVAGVLRLVAGAAEAAGRALRPEAERRSARAGFRPTASSLRALRPAVSALETRGPPRASFQPLGG